MTAAELNWRRRLGERGRIAAQPAAELLVLGFAGRRIGKEAPGEIDGA